MAATEESKLEEINGEAIYFVYNGDDDYDNEDYFEVEVLDDTNDNSLFEDAEGERMS